MVSRLVILPKPLAFSVLDDFSYDFYFLLISGVLEAAEPSPRIFDENSDPAEANPNVLKWIFDNMKAKLLEVIGAISQFLGELSKPLDQDKAEHSDTFSDKLKSSFLLTIMVLLIVVVARGQKA